MLAAVWLVDVLSILDLPIVTGLMRLQIDESVLVFATAVSAVTGIAFGLAPALRAMKTDSAVVLGRFSAPRRHVATRYALLAFQVALSLVLLTGTGLFIRSLLQIQRVDLGIDPTGLVMITTSATQAGYQPAQVGQVYDELDKRIASIPGVTSVVRTIRPPLGRGPTSTLVIEGYVSPTGTNTTEVPMAVVSANYFERLGIALLHGRAFRSQDDRSTPPVAVVSEAMARRYWGTSNAVGRRYAHDGQPDSWVEIVGVVADVKVASLTEEPRPLVYRAWNQTGALFATFLARTNASPVALMATTLRYE